MFEHMMPYIRLTEVMLHYGSPSAMDVSVRSFHILGGRAILNVYAVGEPSSITKYECFGNVSTHDGLRLAEVTLHYTARRVHWTFR